MHYLLVAVLLTANKVLFTVLCTTDSVPLLAFLTVYYIQLTVFSLPVSILLTMYVIRFLGSLLCAQGIFQISEYCPVAVTGAAFCLVSYLLSVCFTVCMSKMTLLSKSCC